MSNLVLEPREFRFLEGFRLNTRKSFSGRTRGERLTKKKGVSIDFSDYRDYVEGDDLRHLDWNVFARLNTPIVKTYQDEEDLAVHLLVDTSASMDFGEPTKFDFALKAASALGYIGLNAGDAVFPQVLGSKSAPLNALRGRAQFPRLDRWLQAQKPSGTGVLEEGLRRFARSSARTGLVVILSDGMDPNIEAAIKLVAGRGHEVIFLQILSQLEIDPDIEGDLRLLDVESPQAVEITANRATLKAYRENVLAHNMMLADVVTNYGGRYQLVGSDMSFSDLVQGVFKREGWIA